MSDWVVETPSFEEDLMNNRVVMLNQVGVNRVVEIIKEKDKEIERLNNIINELLKYIEEKAKENDDNTMISKSYKFALYDIVGKLQELKDSDKENI